MADGIPPSALQWLRRCEGGAAWLDALPSLLQDVARRWHVTVAGPPFTGGSVSLTVPVTRDGETFVLKIQWPHPECRDEAEALRTWNGNGAVRLIAHDPERHALLLEACHPGGYLADHSADDPLDVLIGLLPRLWVPVEDGSCFRSLEAEALAWSETLLERWARAGRPCERRLVDEALDRLSKLAGSQGEQVLIHQDLHGQNVLSAEREPWLVIDPKPISGERAFSLAPIIRSFEFGDSMEATVHRLDRLSRELGLNRDRVLGWTVAQTMAWSFEGAYGHRHHQTVRWLLSAR